jgi:hypothetical protein
MRMFAYNFVVYFWGTTLLSTVKLWILVLERHLFFGHNSDGIYSDKRLVFQFYGQSSIGRKLPAVHY